MKNVGMAISDLATLVRISELNSRDVLAESLSEFANDARRAGRGLTRFNSKIGGAMDEYVQYIISPH
jgi:hypothetical protein